MANVAARQVQPLLEVEAAAEREREAAESAATGVAPAGLLAAIYAERDMLHKPSIWIVGGDGW